jgi:hypothetical protein
VQIGVLWSDVIDFVVLDDHTWSSDHAKSH